MITYLLQAFQGQTTTSTAVTVPHPPNMRPRVRARRGQATDPHSIAERVTLSKYWLSIHNFNFVNFFALEKLLSFVQIAALL